MLAFGSCLHEPLLSAVDLTPWLEKRRDQLGDRRRRKWRRSAAPTHPNWIRSLRDQCAAHSGRTAFPLQTVGPHWSQNPQGRNQLRKSFRYRTKLAISERLSWRPKKLSGRILDGSTHDGYPKPT